MEYILVIVAFCTAVLTADFSISPSARFKNIWSMRPLKKLLFWGLLFVAICQMWVVYQGHCEAEKEKTNLNAHNAELIERNDELKYEVVEANKRLEDTKKQLENANRKLDDNHKLINEQQKLITAQQKSVDSLVFNMPTSLEGKLRFKEIFETLSLFSKFDNDCYEYHCRLLDNGVGVYWFERDTDELKGFCFFSNSDVNAVLSHVPFGEDFINADGEVRVEKESELAAAYLQVFNKKTPQNSKSAPVYAKAMLEIDALIKEMFVYCYRAESVHFTTCWIEPEHRLCRGKRGSFSYIVDPLAEKKERRSGDFDLSDTFIDALLGLSRREFSERLLAKLKELKIEPKVTPHVIRFLNMQWMSKNSQQGLLTMNNAGLRNIEVNKDPTTIIGYNNTVITQGLNNVDVLFTELLKPFPTMCGVLKFVPPENLVGDVIEFDLDGRRQFYEVVRWDGSTSNYVLRTTVNGFVSETTLSSIPLLNKFSIIHKTTKQLSIIGSGKIGSTLIRHGKDFIPNVFERTENPGKIVLPNGLK